MFILTKVSTTNFKLNNWTKHTASYLKLKLNQTLKINIYLEDVDTLDDVDIDEDVDTELELDTLTGKNIQ